MTPECSRCGSNAQVDVIVSFDYNVMEVKKLSKLSTSLLCAFACSINQAKLVGETAHFLLQKVNMNKDRDDVVGEGKKSKFLLK